MAAAAASPPPWQQPLPPADTTNTGTTTPQICLNHHLHHHTTTAGTTATAAASPAAAAAVAGCGRQKGRHRRGGAYKTSKFLFIFSMHGAVRRQTTIVVAVGRWYSHNSRTLWCWACGGDPPFC
nr:hypothetical protein [Tanacetum cinerariifolium]